MVGYGFCLKLELASFVGVGSLARDRSGKKRRLLELVGCVVLEMRLRRDRLAVARQTNQDQACVRIAVLLSAFLKQIQQSLFADRGESVTSPNQPYFIGCVPLCFFIDCVGSHQLCAL